MLYSCHCAILIPSMMAFPLFVKYKTTEGSYVTTITLKIIFIHFENGLLDTERYEAVFVQLLRRDSYATQLISRSPTAAIFSSDGTYLHMTLCT